MRRAALFFLVAMAAGWSVPPARAQAPPAPTRGAAPGSFAPLVKRVVPAVVNISVVEQGAERQAARPEAPGLRDRLNKRDAVLGAGSGFIIDPSGIIVTNTHVVGRATRIAVTLADGTELPAKLIGTDDLTDIAVIRVSSPTPLPYVEWGDSRVVEVGDWILAAGNPFGVGISVTAGIVSAHPSTPATPAARPSTWTAR
jgi:serine protease Do